MNNNQRDPRWANKLIGDMTIGPIGCTVSAVGDVIGTTPDVVVDKLKAVGGFLGNLIIWAKISEAFPGITVSRVWTYDNTAVKNAVPKVIVEVPASAIGGTGSHWVNYIGNQQCKDPWTGTIRPTSDFPNPTGYCIITGTWDNQDPLAVCLAQHVELVNKCNDKDKQISDLLAQITTLQGDKDNLNKQIQDLQQQAQNLRDAFDAQTKADASTGTQLIDISHERDGYKNSLDNIATALSTTPDEKSILGAIQSLRTASDDISKQYAELQKAFEASAIYKRIPKKTLNIWEKIKSLFT